MVKKIKFSMVYSVCFIGLAGIILFFPMNFNDTHTCLYNKYYCSYKNRPCPKMSNPDELNEVHHAMNMNDRGSILLKKYIFPYGFLWWGSLTLFAGSVLFYRKLKS